MSRPLTLDVGALRRSAKAHTASLGHEEAYGYYDAVAHVEDLIAEHPAWQDCPYTDITDRAADICRPSYEDAP